MTWGAGVMEVNQNGNTNGTANGQRTEKEIKSSPNVNGNSNGNGHGTRNQHLHPSLQDPTKSTGQATPPESTTHHHPSFQPFCKHSEEDGDLHSHALDLMALASGGQAMNVETKGEPEMVPASVPTQSYLSAGRTQVPTIAVGNGNGNGSGSAPKFRRMSSSTSQARGKSAAIGTWEPRPAALNHSAPYTGNAPALQRRTSNAGPTLYDFGKTDRRPSQSGSRPMPTGRAKSNSISSKVPASLPARTARLPLQGEEFGFDLQFRGSDDDERSGSGEIEGDGDEMDIDGDDSNPLALGTGSGGVKGRRRGQKFNCEICGKDYMHPGCLSKHRWEHTPQWQDPATVNMSKHQQVAVMEAAIILTAGSSLPKDRSLWPSIVSSDQSRLRSPASSNTAPLTPSSLREPSSFGAIMQERTGKERRTSPGSDSTTSSMGAGDVYPPSNAMSPRPSGLGLRNHYPQPQPQVQRQPSSGSGAPRASRAPSFSNSPRHPSSLPDMAGLHFPGASSPSSHGVSPIPNRGHPLSLQSRAGMIGGGMFGGFHSTARNSSVRSGAADLPDHEEEEELAEHDQHRRGTSSSEEAEERRRGRDGEEFDMAEAMEL